MWAAITRQGMVSPRGSSPSLRRGCDDDAEPAAAGILAVDLDVDRWAHRDSAATDPPDARFQPRRPGGSCSREPPRGNQYLSRGKHAHHDSMGTCATRWPTRQRDRRPQAGSPIGSL